MVKTSTVSKGVQGPATKAKMPGEYSFISIKNGFRFTVFGMKWSSIGPGGTEKENWFWLVGPVAVVADVGTEAEFMKALSPRRDISADTSTRQRQSSQFWSRLFTTAIISLMLLSSELEKDRT